MKKTVLVGLAVVMVMISEAVVCSAGSPAPEGFRLNDGRLLKWGITTENMVGQVGGVNRIGLQNVICGTDGCLIDSGLVPAPYRMNAHAQFNDNRFYEILLFLPSNSFDEVEVGLDRTLNAAPTKKVGNVQNHFGATFDQVEDTWKVGDVRITLTKRIDVDTGGLEMTYLPLAPKDTIKTAPPPF
jgi:hypothetical protein